MIMRRYGSRYHGVTPNFDPHAMNEIGFQKTDDEAIAAEDFTARYERAESFELTSTADGEVQGETEAQVLRHLRKQLEQLHANLKDDELLVVESEIGRDYPKMREKVTGTVVAGANRLHFNRYVDPPLRVAVYRPRQS